MRDFLIERPGTEEYDAFYSTYVGAVADGDVLEQMADQSRTVSARFSGLSEGEADYRYAEGKWSVKEVLGHMADTERVFSYRALCFSRGDVAELPGMDQDVYMAGSRFAERGLVEIVEEFLSVRDATLSLLASFDQPVLDRGGTASGCPVSVRALVYIMTGHAAHHLGVLRERYGV